MARDTEQSLGRITSGHFIWLALTVTFILLAINAGSCSKAQEERVGQGLSSISRSGNPRRDYKYVADMQRMLYWPNRSEYVNAIPKENRVYIADDEMLAQFSGYSRGD